MQPILSTTLSSWVARLEDSGRCLWAIDRKTNVLTWKRREEYSYFNDNSRLKTVFEAMEAFLQNASLSCSNDVANLFKLRSRVVRKYSRYQAGHCWFFKWIFARGFGVVYRQLLVRIDHILYETLRSSSEMANLRSKDQELLFTQLSREGNGEIENRMLANFLEKYPFYLDRLPFSIRSA